MRVFKYPLKTTHLQFVTMPQGAQLLSVQAQHGELQLWALVDETATVHEPRGIRICGTGHPLPDFPGKYISTVVVHNDQLVWHIFEDV